MNRRFLLVLTVAILGEVAAVEAFIYWQQQTSLGCFDVCGCGACQPAGREALNMDLFQVNSSTNVSLNLRNVGSISLSLQVYLVKDSAGDQWQSDQWQNVSTPGPTLSPNSVATTVITIGQSCNSCSYTGATGAFSQFTSTKYYTVEVVTARNDPFTFTIMTQPA